MLSSLTFNTEEKSTIQQSSVYETLIGSRLSVLLELGDIFSRKLKTISQPSLQNKGADEIRLSDVKVKELSAITTDPS